MCPVNSRWSIIVDDTISCLCNAGYAGTDLTGIQSAYSDFSSCVMCDAGKYTDGTNITGCMLCGPGKNKSNSYVMDNHQEDRDFSPV